MKKSIILLSVVLAFLSFGCTSPQDPGSSQDSGTGQTSVSLNVSASSLVFAEAGGSQLVAISGDADWTAVSNQSWCGVSPAQGSGNGAIVVVVQLNDTTVQRSAKVTVSEAGGGHEIVITQAAGQPLGPVVDPHGNSIDASPAALNFTASGGSKSLQITANVSWQISSDQSWCSVSASSGTGNSSINVSASANESYSSRTAMLSISNSEFGLNKKVAVTQSGVDPSSVIIYASYSGNDSNNGKSWSTAVKNISTAIYLAPAGGQVWVEEGTYQENVVMKDGVNVYGGFNHTESSIGDRGTRHSTILNNGFSMPTGVFGFTMPTLVDGFVININASPSAQQSAVNPNVTMNNCDFRQGLIVSGGTVSNSIFNINNYVIWVENGGKILNSRITITNTYAASVYLMQLTSGRLEGCIISARLYSSGSFTPDTLIAYRGNCNVVNCTFQNISDNYGYAVRFFSNLGSGTLNFVNNIVMPIPSISNGSTIGLYSTNNLEKLATEALYFLDADLSPMSNSAAVNAGDSSFVTIDKDILGNPRIQGGKVDIGAIESPY